MRGGMGMLRAALVCLMAWALGLAALPMPLAAAHGPVPHHSHAAAPDCPECPGQGAALSCLQHCLGAAALPLAGSPAWQARAQTRPSRPPNGPRRRSRAGPPPRRPPKPRSDPAPP